MEVVVPMPRLPEFPFDSAAAYPYTSAPPSPRTFDEPFYHFTTAPSSPTRAASPYTSPPQSPRPFGEHFYHFTSAPSSPTRAAAFYTRFTASECPTAPHLRITDASGGGGGGYLFDFTFYPCLQQCLPEIAAADELFEKGRIRPLQPMPSPAAAEADKVLGNRGRDLTSSSNSNRNRSTRELRSSSPVRNQELVAKKRSSFPTNPAAHSAKGGRTSRRWPRLKDLLQFRSASEGRVTGRGSQDPLRKFTLLSSVPLLNKKGGGEDKRSQRCNAGGSSEVGPVRRGAVTAESAHELHCTAKRSAAEEQRKKTPQPYQRHGLLLGLMPFNPAIRKNS